MPRVYLSLGSNMEAEKNLALAVRELAARWGTLTLSPVYRNKAVGFDGDDFLNMVVGFDTDSDVDDIVREIEVIHDLSGRARTGERFAPRSLDIDVLLYGDAVSDGPKVRLPRRDVLEYGFVLRPLADIAGDERHPVTGRSYFDHWQEFEPGSAELTPVRLDF